MSKYLEFEVSLEQISPRIWRRFLLRSLSTFHELRDTIQKACGWQDYHLYHFLEIDAYSRLPTLETKPDPFFSSKSQFLEVVCGSKPTFAMVCRDPVIVRKPL